MYFEDLLDNYMHNEITEDNAFIGSEPDYVFTAI